MIRNTSFALLCLMLGACATESASDRYQRERYSMKKDAYPDRKLDVNTIEDAVPQQVVRTKAGNKSPYSVLGKTYHVMEDPSGFTQSGYASWYGLKFHGHLTSNGETYDMYEMTAAHKTLPIPTYVRVTNLENGLSTVVRVNDRGPFHADRIIDLSYAAATKLEYTNKGTAKVKIEVLDPGQSYQVAESKTKPAPVQVEPKRQAVLESAKRTYQYEYKGQDDNYHLPANTFLQVGAFSNLQSAEKTRRLMETLTEFPVVIREVSDLFKVRIGPLSDNVDLLQLRELVHTRELGKPVVVYD